MPATWAMTLKDGLFLALALLAVCIGVVLAVSGVRAAAGAFRNRQAVADWGRVIHTSAVGGGLIVLGSVGWVLVADKPLTQLETFRSLHGAHSWSVRLVWLGLCAVGAGLVLQGALPCLAVWHRERHSLRPGRQRTHQRNSEGD